MEGRVSEVVGKSVKMKVEGRKREKVERFGLIKVRFVSDGADV